MDRFILLQTIGYFMILVCGLATSITSGLVRVKSGGVCILYGYVINCTLTTANINSSTDSFVSIIFSGGRGSICSFITNVNLLVSVFFASLLCGYHFYFLIRSRVVVHVVYQMWLKILLLSSLFSFVLVLTSACTLAVGLSSWCNSLLSVVNDQSEDLIVVSCTETQINEWQWFTEFNQTIKAESYYYSYTVAETFCWLSVIVWFLQSIIYVYHLIKNQQMKNFHQDQFTIDPFTIDDLDAFT